MSIINLLNQVKNREIVLPAIQRDFVWPENRIYKLLDSIMRGYPIGIVLLWDTYEDIQYRFFDLDFKSDNLHAYQDNTQRKRIKLVLDGQQRLQSLYIALYGTLDGMYLYFDVLSGQDSDDVQEEKYIFSFASSEEVKVLNIKAKQEMKKPVNDRIKNAKYTYLQKVSDLFNMGAAQREDFKDKLTTELDLPKEDRTRLSINLSRFDESLSKDENILKVSTIDENLPSNSPFRKSDTDVLEVFVRVNTEQTQLSRSDLIFSMLKLNWKESAEALPEFVKNVNEGNSFDLDTDFVIRCLFAVSDLGTKFDIDLLRKKSNTTKLRGNFQQCCESIRATVDFVQKDCHCQSSRVIGGAHTMVPFVYYLFHTKNHEIRNDQLTSIKKALYLFAFTKPFSRYQDSRLWAFIRDELKQRASEGDETFPIDAVVWWISYWEKIKNYGEELMKSNPILALHLVQSLSGAKVQYLRNAPEVDHIFPRSTLRDKGFNPAQVNHFANFWILAKGKNQNKSNQHPADYFKDVDDKELQKALIDRDALDYRRYTTFIRNRSDKILKKITEKTQLSEKDFPTEEDSET